MSAKIRGATWRIVLACKNCRVARQTNMIRSVSKPQHPFLTRVSTLNIFELSNKIIGNTDKYSICKYIEAASLCARVQHSMWFCDQKTCHILWTAVRIPNVSKVRRGLVSQHHQRFHLYLLIYSAEQSLPIPLYCMNEKIQTCCGESV